MSEQQPTYSSEDDIGLVDVIAVLVRFRRMIVVGVVVTAMLAIGALWVLPLVGIGGPPRQTYTVRTELEVNSIPAVAGQYLAIDLPQLVLAQLRDERFIAPIFDRYRRDLNEDYQEFNSHPEYVRYIRDDVIGETYDATLSASTSLVVLSCTCEQPDVAIEFLDEVLDSLPSALQPTISRQTQTAIGVVQRSLESVQQSLVSLISVGTRSITAGNGGQLDPDSLVQYIGANATESMESLSELITAEESLRRLNGQLGDFLSRAGDPVVIANRPEGRSRVVTLALVVIAAAFAFVLVAFVRQYIHKVSSDPAEMAKLRAAWARTKPDES